MFLLYLIDPVTDLILLLLLEVFAFITVPIVAILYVGYNRRKGFALKMLRRNFFHAGIIMPTGIIEWHNYLNKEIKHLGAMSAIRINKGIYRLPNVFNFNGKIPIAMWKEGNPKAIRLDPEPLSSDAKIQSDVEFKEAIDDQVTHDLLKFNFSKLEITYIALSIVNILMTAILVYMVYTTSTLLNDIANYLGTNIPKLLPHIIGLL